MAAKTDKSKKAKIAPAKPKPQRAAKAREPKKRGKNHVTRPTVNEEIVIAERRELVLALATKGVSIRQIAAHLKDKGFEHCSRSTVHEDLEAELENRARHRITNADLLVEAELEKIDNWEFRLSPLLEKNLSEYNNIDAKISLVNALIRLQNQRDKFLRISKPPEIKVDVDVLLAKLTGLDPEELPDADDDSAQN